MLASIERNEMRRGSLGEIKNQSWREIISKKKKSKEGGSFMEKPHTI